jgi:hypothetical protein
MPAWIVTALGIGLGVIGLAHVITHPEPLPVWILEGVLVTATAAIIVYGGYWIATHSLGRTDRWIVAGWTLCGAAVAVAFVAGFVLSERLSGGLVTEAGQLLIFGALGGSVVALLAVISTQRRHHVPTVARPDEEWDDPAGSGSPSQSTGRRPPSEIGSQAVDGSAGTTCIDPEVTVSKDKLATLLSFVEGLPVVESLEDDNHVKRAIYGLKRQCLDDVCELCATPAEGTHRLSTGRVICEAHARALRARYDEYWHDSIEPIRNDE